MMTIAGFIERMSRVLSELPKAENRGLHHGAEIIQHEAQHLIGRENENWAPLSSATLEGFRHPLAGYLPGKIELGYTGRVSATDPLLRTGELRASIEVSSEGHEARVGTHDEIAIYQEMGTPDAMYPIPPRPFLSAAAFNKGEEAAKAVGEEVQYALAGQIKTPDF